MRPSLVLLTILVFAIEPQQRMGPEECERAAKQEENEFRGEPGVRITMKIVSRRMWLEAGKANGRANVAFLAKLQAMVGLNTRGRVAHSRNVVRSRGT